jgi:cytochrome c556
MRIRHALGATLAGLLLCAALPASAQFQKPQDAIKYRKAAFGIMGTHFGRLGAMANGKIPFDAAAAKQNAEVAAFMSQLPWEAFGPGTEGGDARPEVWKEQAKFKELSDDMRKKMGELDVAAKTGDLDKIKTAFGAVGMSCKTCHDSFKEK